MESTVHNLGSNLIQFILVQFESFCFSVSLCTFLYMCEEERVWNILCGMLFLCIDWRCFCYIIFTKQLFECFMVWYLIISVAFMTHWLFWIPEYLFICCVFPMYMFLWRLAQAPTLPEKTKRQHSDRHRYSVFCIWRIQKFLIKWRKIRKNKLKELSSDKTIVLTSHQISASTEVSAASLFCLARQASFRGCFNYWLSACCFLIVFFSYTFFKFPEK